MEIEVRWHGGVKCQTTACARGRKCPAEAPAGRSGVGQSRAKGSALRKVVSPAARKDAVSYLVAHGFRSKRKACVLVGLSRTSLHYQHQRPQRDAPLKDRLLVLAARYPRYGYLMLHGLMKNEGLVTNRKRTWRLY